MHPVDSSERTAEILTVTVTDLARGGSGVAREANGRVLFIPFTAPGDQVRVRITGASKRYADAEILEIIKPSPTRIPPSCGLFGRCGGCQWQHIPYEVQWNTKTRGIRHALERVGIPAPSSWEEFPATHPWNYRNRVQLRGFQEEIGFYAARSHQVINAARCPVARSEINAAWEELRTEGSRLPRPYKVEVEVLPDGQIRKIWNSAHAAAGFRQVNDEQNERLRAWIACNLPEGRIIYDLFGGSGNLSLGLAPRMREIHCVDVTSPSPSPAGTPANYHFHRASALSWLLSQTNPMKKPKGDGPDSTGIAILDPPRSGLADDFEAIAHALDRLNVKQLIAVGCDPDAWIRDVSRFRQRGWTLEKVAVVDFFPQTPHIESVALLRV